MPFQRNSALAEQRHQQIPNPALLQGKGFFSSTAEGLGKGAQMLCSVCFLQKSVCGMGNLCAIHSLASIPQVNERLGGALAQAV